MNERTLAALFVLVVWWLSTGVVLKMVWLGRSTFLVGAVSVVGLGGLWGLLASSRVASPASAYLAFTCALAVWAWHELLFLLGIVTGPRKIGCPPDARGWKRFRYATASLIHHELALALTLLVVVALTWGGENQVGTETFAVLWSMRLSAKLNVYLGVRNLTEQFVPVHLRYMLSYFRHARMNWLMPLSLLAASAVTLHLAAAAATPGATPFAVVGHTLVATILALAVLEHVFLALPLPDALLWRWAIRKKASRGTEPLPDLGAEAP